MRMIRYYLPAIGWIILILFLCTMPGQSVPEVGLPYMDKIAHFGLFGGTVILLAYGYYRQKGDINLLALTMITFSVVLYGVAIEFIQKYFAENRSFDMLDVLADGLGAIAGALIFTFVGKRFLK
ncbi:VanZ family protein [Chitinophaga lutea]